MHSEPHWSSDSLRFPPVSLSDVVHRVEMVRASDDAC